MTRKVLITAALPYVNNVPHLGNLIGATLSADVYARFCRSRGYETLYVCGTDEHGTATETKARQEGVSPKELCDKYAVLHKQIYDWFGISFDVFGRTSDPGHKIVTQQIYSQLNERGYILEKETEQLYSEPDAMFLADRYVLGTCPKCGFADARGDQCDKCDALLTPLELITPRSAISGATPVLRKTKHLYIDLAALQPALTEWLAGKRFSENTMRTTQAWLDRGLEPRAITRDLKWGVPVPREGYEHKVFYVWFDAPIGYISMTGQSAARVSTHALDSHSQRSQSAQSQIDYWWRDERTELYQFIGKDNIPFHSVIFPSMLIGSGENLVTVTHINTTEFLNYEGTKFSKSRGIGLFGDNAMELEFSADAWRYYLLTNRPEQADTNFSWLDFQGKLNGELVGNLGNLVNRTVSFLNQFCDGVVPASNVRDTDTAFRAEVDNQIGRIAHELESVKLKDALHSAMRLSMLGNAFFQNHQPWKTRTQSPEDCAATLSTLANFLVELAVVIEPFMPQTAHAIAKQLNTTLPKWSELGEQSVWLVAGHRVAQNEILFAKVDDARISELRTRFAGVQEAAGKSTKSGAEKNKSKSSSVASAQITQLTADQAWSAVELVVGTITSVERHPNADKLFVERVDLGSQRGVRTIVSGLAAHYDTADLLGKTIVVVANLAPAKLRGVVSEGMLLAAENAEGIVCVVETDAAKGTVLSVAGEPHGLPDGVPITYEVFSLLALEQRADGLYNAGQKLHAGTHGLRTDKSVQGPVH